LLQQARTNRRNKRLAQQVIDEKNKAEAIVHSINDGILVIDSNDKVSLMNAACVKILGVSEHELLGKRLLDVLKIREFILLHMEASKRLDEVVSDEIALPNPQDSDTTLYIIAIAKTLRDKSGEPLGVVTVLRDITQEKEIRAMKANFLATVSHELRTPLTSIVSTFELLSRETLGALNQEQREFIDTSREQGKVLSELIDNLIDLSSLESGEMELHPEHIDIESLTQDASNSVHESATAKGLEFFIDIEPDLPQLVADKAKILRLFKLLLSNAVKFTKEGSVRLVIASTFISPDESGLDHKGMKFSIIDSGIGMTRTHQAKVFEKFYQVDNSTTREFRGSGLGLSICKAIVEAHYGRIWIESELHEGTTVHVVLPIHQHSRNDAENA
jgi:PAS domain S-box-containing protein